MKANKKDPDYSCWKEWHKTLRWEEFLAALRPFRHVRVGVKGSDPPFGKMFFRVAKKELIDAVRTNRAEVTFTVMVDPRVPGDVGTMFVHRVRMTLLDKKTNNNKKFNKFTT